MPLRMQDGDGTLRDMTPEEEAAFWEGRPQPGEPQTPRFVSRRQFFQACAKLEIISQDAALAAISRQSLPAEIEAAIGALPEDRRFDARCEALGADEFDLESPLVELVRVVNGFDIEQVKAIWTLGSTL